MQTSVRRDPLTRILCVYIYINTIIAAVLSVFRPHHAGCFVYSFHAYYVVWYAAQSHYPLFLLLHFPVVAASLHVGHSDINFAKTLVAASFDREVRLGPFCW